MQSQVFFLPCNMPALRHSESRSRIIVISRPTLAVARSTTPSPKLSDVDATESLSTYLSETPPAGLISTGIYLKNGRRFFARLLSNLTIAQVYQPVDAEEGEQSTSQVVFIPTPHGLRITSRRSNISGIVLFEVEQERLTLKCCYNIE